MQGKFLVKRLPKLSSQLNDYSPTLILQRSRQGINFSMPLLNLYYFTVVKYGDQNYYLIRHILIKVQLSKFTLNSVNIHKNVPWYTENKACRAELGRYPLSIDIKASLLCYWQRLEQKSDNPLLNEAFIYLSIFLIGHAAWEIWFNQSEPLPKSG